MLEPQFAVAVVDFTAVVVSEVGVAQFSVRVANCRAAENMLCPEVQMPAT